MQRYGLTIKNDVYMYIYICVCVFVCLHMHTSHMIFFQPCYSMRNRSIQSRENKGSVKFLCNFKYGKYPPEV